MSRFILIAFFFISFGAPSPSLGKSVHYLGFLENFAPSRIAPPVRARVAFMKEGSEWVPMPNTGNRYEDLKRLGNLYPKSVAWHIAYNGASLGTLKSHWMPLEWWANVGMQSVPADFKAPVKTFGKDAFGQSMTDLQVVSRPLLLNSDAHCEDPERWRLDVPTAAEQQVLVKAFRATLSQITNCKDVYDMKGHLEGYRDRDIRFSDRSFRSIKGEFIAGLGLDRNLYRCDGPAGDDFSEYWFLLSPGQKPKMFCKDGTPVEAADVDGDGYSEWFFYKSDYNRNGYFIFYDHWSKSALFEWSYH